MRSDIQGNSIIRDDDMMTTCINIILYVMIYDICDDDYNRSSIFE